MYQNIPLELRQIPKWVVWRLETLPNGKTTKVPYAPSLRMKASVINPHTWGTFDQACAAAQHPEISGIGFVLTENDPYTGIDIDNKPENPASEEELRAHERIINTFESYTERSPGGRGLHIIIKGKVPGGYDRGHVGVYSTKRYLTFTGDVVRNVPIADCQQYLTELVKQMVPTEDRELDDSVEGHLTDNEVHEMARNASNGEKYYALTLGKWEELGYSSQSEADYALMDMLAYYTRDNEQVRRIFRYTQLGKRDKAQRDAYLNIALRKIRGEQPSEQEIAAAEYAAQAMRLELEERTRKALAEQTVKCMSKAEREKHLDEQYEVEPHTPLVPMPPGYLGGLATYMQQTMTRPVPEAAMLAAVGLCAAVLGRAYNISGTGLNQYLLYLAPTGTGKEGIGNAVNNLLHSARQYIPTVDQFSGPSAFASGQGLIRTIDAKPSFLSILGEFGTTLRAMADPRAPAATVILRKVLLDLYGKSGWGSMLQPTAYSDTEKNTKAVHAPALSLLAESTPETFYEGIGLQDVADGLIPRFHVVEYRGIRPPRNRNQATQPPQRVLEHFVNLCSASLSALTANACTTVAIHPDALAKLDAFDVQCDRHINATENGAERQLWNRAHLKALKLAGLLAACNNPHAPIVTTDEAQWAIDFVTRGTVALVQHFSSGEVGTGEVAQEAVVWNVVERYYAMTEKEMKKCSVQTSLLKAGIIPYKYILFQCKNYACMKNDRRGSTAAVKQQLATLVETGRLVEIPKMMAKERYNTAQILYFLGSR